jgi:uncharacterized protein (DUF2267 family)
VRKSQFIHLMRDAFYALSVSANVPVTLPEELIDLYVNETPEHEPDKLTGATSRDYAERVARDVAREYNQEWGRTNVSPFSR